MQELTNKVMGLNETSGLGIACGSLLSHGGAKSAAAFHSSLNLKGTPSCAGKKTAMKKLMFAAAVAACATVGLATETGITSANIVGYAGTQCDDDYGTKLMTPQFVDVAATTGIKLGDLKPVADTDYEISKGDVDIQCLDNGGCTINEKWYNWDGSKWVYFKGTKKGQDASDETITVGAGISVGCGVDPDDANITLQSAGQVGTADALVELDQDYGTVLAGNPFPIEVTLGQLTLEVNVGSEYEIGKGDVDIQFLDNGGCTINEKWYNWDGSKWVYFKGTKKGQDASAETITAGSGFSVGCGVDPDDAVITLRIPAPEL